MPLKEGYRGSIGISRDLWGFMLGVGFTKALSELGPEHFSSNRNSSNAC